MTTPWLISEIKFVSLLFSTFCSRNMNDGLGYFVILWPMLTVFAYETWYLGSIFKTVNEFVDRSWQLKEWNSDNNRYLISILDKYTFIYL